MEINGYLILYGLVLLLAVYAVIFTIWANVRVDKQVKIKQKPTPECDFYHYFTPRRKVEWFDFMGLVHSFKRVSLSTETLSIIDKREVEAVFGIDPPKEANELQKELWVDFMADTGDGMNSTATVFSAITRNELTIEDKTLPRGNILIIGGDLVYPVANEQSYIDRFKGPMRFIYPNNVQTEEDIKLQPLLLATPGNHDWYDGLTAFFRLVCQQKNIGNYKTIQNRSYFAYRLLNNVHIMGVDNQLMGDIDIPQINFFKKYVADLKSASGVIHNIIIIVAEPYWYNYVAADAGKRRQRMDSLVYLINEIKEKNSDIKIQMVISGDIHHYSRYHNKSGNSDVQNYVTSGGGGAFMHMTDFLKPEIELPCIKSPDAKGANADLISNRAKMYSSSSVYERKEVYPTAGQSKKHNRHNLLFAIHNYRFVSIVLGLALISNYLCYNSGDFILNKIGFALVPCFILFVVSKMQIPEKSGREKIHSGIWMLVLAVFSFLLNFLFFCWMPEPHILMAYTRSDTAVLDYVLRFCSIAIFQTILLGLYLFFSYRISKIHVTEASSSYVNEGYKNFLRMKISETAVEVYVVGIKKAQNWWKALKKADEASVIAQQINLAKGDEAGSLNFFGKEYKKENIFLVEKFTINFK